MSKLNVKSMKKSTLDHLITFAMVIVAYLIVQILIAAGVLSSLMQGLLVPMCTYSIVAIGLNLCVGYLGELSIGHAGFMCVGAFSSAFATKLLQNVIPNQILLFIIVLIIGTDRSFYHCIIDRNRVCSIFRIPDRYPGTALKR